MGTKTDARPGAATCPRCGAAVVNVQGLSVCQRCPWTAR